jgi:hypothetical protein
MHTTTIANERQSEKNEPMNFTHTRGSSFCPPEFHILQFHAAKIISIQF